MKRIITLLFLGVFLFSCGNETLPKPKPYLKLQYPLASYKKLNTDCPYNFEIGNQAIVEMRNDCWMTLKYPSLKASIHITYREVDNNLDEILKEVERLTYEHTIKADAIKPNAKVFDNFEKMVFGSLSYVEGNVASNLQFRATDSINHVLSGALYFYAKPNYDSIIPAIKFIEKDMKHLVETIEWK